MRDKQWFDYFNYQDALHFSKAVPYVHIQGFLKDAPDMFVVLISVL